MVSFYQNMSPLQQTWATENGYTGLSNDEIAIKQVAQNQPDILWYTHYDEALLKEILQKVHTIRKVIGWVGSAIPRTNVWKHMDMILSCAPETATYFKQEGQNGVHIHHAFDTRILNRLGDEPKQFDLVFIGQLIKAKGFHNEREQLLEQLAQQLSLTVFSPITEQFTFQKRLLSQLEKALSATVKAAGQFSFLKKVIDKNIELKRIHEKEAVNWELSPALKRVVRNAVFGMDMYHAIHSSKAVLNIHADSSPLYASNMRLWETTGVGSCLLTDWKQNVQELFVPDEEVVVYKSAAECLDKITWLLSNPIKLQQIAEAGQQRCIRDHCYEKRAEQLVPIIRGLLN
jgi:spore maturation protein CgeB